MNKIIIPTGYMGSGSSAITDLLSEVDGYVSPNGNYEYVFMHCPNGIFDLEDKLLIGNNAIRSDEALHSFYECMKNLCVNKHYWIADYNRKIDKNFMSWCEELINLLIDDRFTDVYWYYQENPNFQIYLKKILSKFLKIISYNKINIKPGLRYKEMWISYVTEKNFYNSVKIFLQKFFESMGIKNNNIILDQFILPHNLFRISNYFEDNCKIIVVDRDPRDVFLLNKYYWKKVYSSVPYSLNVQEFCKAYKNMRMSEKESNNKNIKRIHFEDLVYNYDKEIKLIFEFLNIDPKSHIKPKSRFVPEKSIVNTQVFNKNLKFIEESKYIEKYLCEYIYNFPYLTDDEITNKNLIL